MSKFNIPKPNLLEKAISIVSPSAAFNRYKARFALSAASHVGASTGRRQTQEWVVSKGASADVDIADDLPRLRDRSRDLLRNNAIATGLIKTKVTNVVGSGLMFQSRVNNEVLNMSDEQADKWNSLVEAEYNAYFNSVNCDMERQSTLGELTALAFRSMLEAGDVVGLMPYKRRLGDTYGTKLQLIEADRLANPFNRSNDKTLTDGVEFDERTGEPVRYHILKTHPGALYNDNQFATTPVEAFSNSGRRNVIHLFVKQRIGQHRGIPDLTPVIESLKQLGDYKDAELMAATISSMFTVFIKSETNDLNPLAPMTPVNETGGKTSDTDYKLGVGAILDLGMDESVEFADPKRPNTAYGEFVMNMCREIGVALEIPYEILIKHFTASYSASRAAMVVAWQYFNSMRFFLVSGLLKPLYANWFEEAVLMGRISAPGFVNGDPLIRQAYLNAYWIGPSMPQIDEGKEIDASIKRMSAHLSTLADETARLQGTDYQSNLKQAAKENKMKEELGLNIQPMEENSDGGNNANVNQDKKEDETNEVS